jgi:hypothetical protein
MNWNLVKQGIATKWKWSSFQLQLLLMAVIKNFIGLLRAIDPLGWNGILPGQFDIALACLFCSLSTGLLL